MQRKDKGFRKPFLPSPDRVVRDNARQMLEDGKRAFRFRHLRRRPTW
jgi:hypothetical protein